MLRPPPDQFLSLELGRVLPTGWSKQQVLDDLDASGSMFPNGKLEELGDPPGVGLYYVPEPSSYFMLIVGVFGLSSKRRRR